MSRTLDPISGETPRCNGQYQSLMIFPPLEKEPFGTKKRRRLINNVSNGPLHSFGLDNSTRIYSSFHPSGFFPETYGYFHDLRYPKGRNQFDISLKLDESSKKNSTQQLKAREKNRLLKQLRELQKFHTSSLQESPANMLKTGSSSQGSSTIKHIRPKLAFVKFQNPITAPLNTHSRSAYKLASTQPLRSGVLRDYEIFPTPTCVLERKSVARNEPHTECSLALCSDSLTYERLRIRN